MPRFTQFSRSASGLPENSTIAPGTPSGEAAAREARAGAGAAGETAKRLNHRAAERRAR